MIKKYSFNFFRKTKQNLVVDIKGKLSFYFDDETNSFFSPTMKINAGSVFALPNSKNVKTSGKINEFIKKIDNKNTLIKDILLGERITRELNTIFAQNVSKGLYLKTTEHNFNISLPFIQSLFNAKRLSSENNLIEVEKRVGEIKADFEFDLKSETSKELPKSMISIIKNKKSNISFRKSENKYANKFQEKYSENILKDVLYRYICLGQSFRKIEVETGIVEQNKANGGGFIPKKILDHYWSVGVGMKREFSGFSKSWLNSKVESNIADDNSKLIANDKNNNVYKYLSNTFSSGEIKSTTGYVSLDLLSDFIVNKMNDNQKMSMGIGDYKALSECSDFYTNVTEFIPSKINEENTPKYKIINDFNDAQRKINSPSFSFFSNKHNLIHSKSHMYNEELIVGSSNFTHNGSNQGNYELSISTTNKKALSEYSKWFSQLKKEGEDIKCEVSNILGSKGSMSEQWVIKSKVIDKLIPEEEEILLPGMGPFRESKFFKKLYPHQKDAFLQAVKGLENNNVFMIADAVGLGKTPVALSVMRYFEEVLNYKSMVFAPKSVIEGVWSGLKTDKDSIFDEIWTFKTGSISELSSKNIGRKYSEDLLAAYKLIIIDEAHYFRNQGSIREKTFKKLIEKAVANGTKILLLTATPIYNKFSDLTNQLFLGKKPENAGYIRDFLNNMKLEDGEYAEQIRENTFIHNFIKSRFISRSKSFIRKNYSNNLKMPKKLMVNDIECEEQTRQYKEFIELIENLVIGGAQGIIKFMLIKRLEESFCAFRSALQRMEKGLFIVDPEDIVVDENIINKNSGVHSIEQEFKKIKSSYEVDKNTLRVLLDKCSEDNFEDPKYTKLKNIIKNKGSSIKEGIAIFTTSIATAEMLFQKLKKDFSEYEIGCISGSHMETSNEHINGFVKEHKDIAYLFSPETMNSSISKELEDDPIIGAATHKYKLDILIMSDKFAEGINLQQNKHLINYNHPWTPMINQQRVGRIYRVGSNHKEIEIYNFLPSKILEEKVGTISRLIMKSRIAGSITDMPRIFKMIEDTESLQLNKIEAKIDDLEEVGSTMDMFIQRNNHEILKSKDKEIKPGWFTLLESNEEDLFNLFECEGEYLFLRGMEKISTDSFKNLKVMNEIISDEENHSTISTHNSLKRMNLYDEMYSEYLIKQIKQLPKKYKDKKINLVATIFVVKKQEMI